VISIPPAASRLWWILALVLVLNSPPLAAQGVGLEVTLAPDSTGGGRDPIVRASHLLTDRRWGSVLHSGFPVRLHFRVELWRDRDAWFDNLRRQVEWDVIVRREPLLDQYTVSTIAPATVGERRYASLEALGRALGYAYRITIRPTTSGEYYYAGILEIATLSDSDIEELDRFLRGDLGAAAGGGETMGDALSRGARRLLLKLGGLPSLRLETRSERFRVP